MRRRGFTLVECAVVISILGLMAPAGFLLVRQLVIAHQRAAFLLESAEMARTLGEELRSDLRLGRLASGEVLQVVGAGPCFPVKYRVEHGSLVREPPPGCGEGRGLARGVRALRRGPGIITLELGIADDPPVSMVIPLGGPE